jgi:hypothetical protein
MLIWTVVGIGISYGVNVGMYMWLGDAAFPWNLIVVVVLFLAISWFYIKRQMKKLPPGASFLGGPSDKSSELRYECSKCGFRYKGMKCPRCGNNGGRAVFG